MSSRREFLAAGVTGALGAMVVSPFGQWTGCQTLAEETKSAENKQPFPIVDTHTHFYDPTRPEGVPWPGKDDKALYRRVLPEDYRKIAEPLGVKGTVVVEASSWVEDNQWVLNLAEKAPFVLGLVGNLTPGKPEFAGHLARFAKNKFFRGIRVNAGPLKQGLEDEAYLADIKRLHEAGLELDVNGGPDLLPLVAQLAGKLPDLRIVINHLANVKIDGPKIDENWKADLQTASRHKHVFLKVSALVEGAARDGRQAPRDPGYYVPILDVAWGAFGEDRVIYGSNWPVSERFGDLDTVQKIVSEYALSKGRGAAEKFFAKNAKAAYQWPDR